MRNTKSDGVLGLRPRSGNPDMPFYSPERDFGVQGIRILNEVELAIHDGRFNRLLDTYEEICGEIASESQRAETLRKFNAAGLVMMEYMADAQGKVYEPGTSKWKLLDKPLSFEEACRKLSRIEPLVKTFMQAMIGHFSLDAFFFGERQAAAMGSAHHKDYNRYMDMVSQMSVGLSDGLSIADVATQSLMNSVDAMWECGFTDRTILSVVSQQIAKTAGAAVE